MRRTVINYLIIFICFTGLLTSCSSTKSSVTEASTSAITENQQTIAATTAAVTTEASEEEMKFTSMEEAYYRKYIELAERYGTHSLSDNYSVKGKGSEHSHLNGVCVVNLMDFNGDGVQDLFVVYSNGKRNEVITEGDTIERYEIPDKNSYEFEIWTYMDGGLTQILHESGVSSSYTYPNDKSVYFLKYYRNFITIYENEDGFPVIQIYDDGDEAESIQIYITLMDRASEISSCIMVIHFS